MRIALVVITLAISAVAMADDTPTKIDDLKWLTGSWVQEKNGETVEELWMAPKGGLMLGLNRTTSKKSTQFEYMRIVQKKDSLIFIAQPAGRAPTEFPATKIDKNSVIFENPKNDFPSKITYSLKSNKQLYAKIEGIVQGKPLMMDWTWTQQETTP